MHRRGSAPLAAVTLALLAGCGTRQAAPITPTPSSLRTTIALHARVALTEVAQANQRGAAADATITTRAAAQAATAVAQATAQSIHRQRVAARIHHPTPHPTARPGPAPTRPPTASPPRVRRVHHPRVKRVHHHPAVRRHPAPRPDSHHVRPTPVLQQTVTVLRLRAFHRHLAPIVARLRRVAHSLRDAAHAINPAQADFNPQHLRQTRHIISTATAQLALSQVQTKTLPRAAGTSTVAQMAQTAGTTLEAAAEDLRRALTSLEAGDQTGAGQALQAGVTALQQGEKALHDLRRALRALPQ